MWFLCPLRNYKTNPAIDEFIYKLIISVENGANLYATDNGAFVYHIDIRGVTYNLWGANKYYGYLSCCGTGYSDQNLWDGQMPSRKCMWDFMIIAKKYCIMPEKPQYRLETRKRLANLP